MRILNFGSLNIDYTYRVPHIVAPGETLQCMSLQLFPGGKGLNQSIALAKAGADVYHAGFYGEDGIFLKELFEKEGVHTDFTYKVETGTGNAIIQVTDEGQNSIIIYPGANNCVTEEIADEVLSHFGEGDYLLLQNEVNGIDYIIEKAAKRGMKIWFNPSPFNDRVKTCDLSKVDVFLMNEVEGEQITGQKEPEVILDAIALLYPKAKVVLTLGDKGAWFMDGAERTFSPAEKVTAVDTTGAGDTFTGYFMEAIAEGMPASAALALAGKAAAIAIGKPGAAISIPYRKDVIV